MRKHFLKILIFLQLAIVAGCDNKKKDLVGTWKIIEITNLGNHTIPDKSYTTLLEFNGDGTGNYSVHIQTDKIDSLYVESNFRYKYLPDSNKLLIYYNHPDLKEVWRIKIENKKMRMECPACQGEYIYVTEKTDLK